MSKSLGLFGDAEKPSAKLESFKKPKPSDKLESFKPVAKVEKPKEEPVIKKKENRVFDGKVTSMSDEERLEKFPNGPTPFSKLKKKKVNLKNQFKAELVKGCKIEDQLSMWKSYQVLGLTAKEAKEVITDLIEHYDFRAISA